VRLLQWLTGVSPRAFRAERTIRPGLVAYYWDGAIPTGRRVRNISLTGAFIEVPDRWYVGTLLNLTLQITTPNSEDVDSAACLVLTCRVVRHAPDGIGVTFMLHRSRERRVLARFLRRVGPANSALQNLRATGTEGQSLIEFALVLPLLFLLIVNAVNFGAFIYAWITVANAARAGVQYYALGGASATLPQLATAATLQALVTQDTASLPNSASLVISACRNNNGTVTALVGTCPTLLPDPEASLYISAAVDVTYTYQPFIPLFDFPNLGIHATLPPTTIHRQAVMRVLN
jgi:TadE-like protein/PilZ domain